jgi:hypothetical protein
MCLKGVINAEGVLNAQVDREFPTINPGSTISCLCKPYYKVVSRLQIGQELFISIHTLTQPP